MTSATIASGRQSLQSKLKESTSTFKYGYPWVTFISVENDPSLALNTRFALRSFSSQLHPADILITVVPALPDFGLNSSQSASFSFFSDQELFAVNATEKTSPVGRISLSPTDRTVLPSSIGSCIRSSLLWQENNAAARPDISIKNLILITLSFID